MRLRVTRSGQSLKPEVVEGELVLYCPGENPPWEPTELSLVEAVKACGCLAMLVEVQGAGQSLWATTKVALPPEKRSSGGWLVRSEGSSCSVEELPADAEAKRLRRATGVVPILAPIR